ncbi:MAG: aspartate aminotransferase [Limisphaerales bacterium]|jgi:aspartate aminotransferase
MSLARRITELPESATIKMAKLSRKLKAEGQSIVDLSLGMPDFNTPVHIGEAAKEAIDQHYTFYNPVPGYLDIREAICRKFKKDNGLVYDPDQIVMSTGAKQSIANVVSCLCDPGDEVLLPVPYWVSYVAMAELAQAKVVEVPSSIDQDFKITAEILEKNITPKSKLMIFSSPCNPSGSVYSKEELEALAAVILAHDDLYVVSDEIYEHINFTGSHFSIGAVPGMEARTITVNGLSKAYAMTGWRLGYIGAPKEIAAACSKYQSQFTSATNSITQRTVIAALEGDQAPRIAMNEAFARRRELMAKLLGEIDGLKINMPEGAFYFFPDASSFFGKSAGDRHIKNADDLCMYLLEIGGVALVSGTPFGAPNCFRLSYAAADESLVEAVKRIKSALEKLS